jgi:hypothetical protein
VNSIAQFSDMKGAFMARDLKKQPAWGYWQVRWVCCVGAVLLACLTLSVPANARNANDKVCFPNLQWYTLVNNNTPPVIDGNIAGDPGWNGAFRYVFGNGTNTPDVIVQGIRDSADANIYISVQANNLLDWDPFTFVTLTFDPGGGAQQQALVIQPIPNGASSAAASPPNSVKYYLGSVPFGTQATPWSPAPPIMTGFATSGTNYQWYMEARFPIDSTGNNGINIPKTGTFGFYADVVRIVNETPTDPPGSGLGAESFWPVDASGLQCSGSPGVVCEPAAAIPAASTWGNGTIDPASACQGVSVTSQVGNIYTNHGVALTGYGVEPSISLSLPNIFSAYVQNTSVNTSGTPVVAQGVNATFKIANFGLPAPDSWIVPGSEAGGSPIVGDNPAGPLNVDATACQGATNNNSAACTINTGAWSLNAAEQSAYNTPATLHQCIQVVLDATPGTGSNTFFINNTATQNMNFLPSGPGPMGRIAEISAKGYLLPTGMTDQLFDIGIMSRVETPRLRDAATVVQGNASNFVLEAHGCRHTNNFVQILKQKIELCDNVGGFGFIAQATKTTTLSQWSQSLTGSGLTKVKDNVYSVHVPNNGVVQLTATVTALPGSITTGLCGKNSSSGATILLTVGIALIGVLLYWRIQS